MGFSPAHEWLELPLLWSGRVAVPPAARPGGNGIASPPLPGLSKTEISSHVAEEESGMLVFLEILV